MASRKPDRKSVASTGLNPTLAKLLSKLRDGGVECVPDGWQKVADIAAEWKISTATARHHLRRLLTAGLAEMRTFRVRSGNMATADVRHYRIME